MNHPVIVDVETQNSFQEVKHDLAKLKVSLAGTYDYKSGLYKAYRENELPDLFRLMEHASEIIGFNLNKFDLPVLAPYYLGNIRQFPTLDLLDLVYQSLGFRLALNDLARATLGMKKSGHGFMAINYFRQGAWEELEKYCLDDVRITRELYEYAKLNSKLLYQSAHGTREIKINLTPSKKTGTVSLSLGI